MFHCVQSPIITVRGTSSVLTKISWLAPFFFLPSIRKNVHAAAYIRPRSGIYTSLNARCRCPAWQLKAFLAAKNDLPGMDQRPPTWMPIYGQASQPSIYLGGEKRGNGPRYDRRKDRGRRLDDNNVYEDRGKKSLGP